MESDDILCTFQLLQNGDFMKLLVLYICILHIENVLEK